MKKHIAVSLILITLLLSSCVFEGEVTTTSHTEILPVQTTLSSETTAVPTPQTTAAMTTLSVTTTAKTENATKYRTLSMGYGLYTIDLPEALGKVEAQATLSADKGTLYFNKDRSVTLQTYFAPVEEYTGSSYYLTLWPDDGATYEAEEPQSIKLGDRTFDYWFAADKNKCFLWLEGKDSYMGYTLGLELPAEYKSCLNTILKSFTINEKLLSRYRNKEIVRSGNLWLAWDNSIAISAADDWTAAVEPLNSRYPLALTWHDGDQLIMIHHTPGGEYQDTAKLKADFASLVKTNAEESMGLSASEGLWSEVWEDTLSGVMNVPIYFMLRTASSSNEPHVLYAGFVYQGELFNCVFMTMPWVEQEQLKEWTDMLFSISTCP